MREACDATHGFPKLAVDSLRKPPSRVSSSPWHSHAAADTGPARRLLEYEGCRGAAGIALGLGHEEATFEAAAAGGTTGASSYWTARVIFYPPLPQVRPDALPGLGRA